MPTNRTLSGRTIGGAVTLAAAHGWMRAGATNARARTRARTSRFIGASRQRQRNLEELPARRPDEDFVVGLGADVAERRAVERAARRVLLLVGAGRQVDLVDLAVGRADVERVER